MTKYIFLDVDGVLNKHEPIDPFIGSSTLASPFVRNLNSILAETDAKIVLVSAWRYMILTGEMSLRGFGYLLQTHGVHQDTLIGYTDADQMCRVSNRPFPNQRGRQVREWLEKHASNQEHRYAILDDLDLGYTEHASETANNFFHVKHGLNKTLAVKVIGHLNGVQRRRKKTDI